MSGVKKYDYTTIKQAILDYTEVDDSVFTTTILDGFIMAAEFRIYQELPMDAQRNVQEGTLAANDNTINAPAGCLFVRGVEVFNSTSATTGNGTWLEKKDQTYLSEYTDTMIFPKSSFSIVLNNHYFLIKHICWKFSRSHQEDPRSCQDQHIKASELLSLHASEPLGLRVPAAKCLCGCREAQTII